jgi:hypothetical protein
VIQARIKFEAKQAMINEFSVHYKSLEIHNALTGSTLYEIPSWSKSLQDSGFSRADSVRLGGWLDSLLGVGLKEEVH